VWYSKEEYYSIHTSTEWSCRKDEHDTDGKIGACSKVPKLGHEFLAEAVGKTCYLVNRSSSSTLMIKLHTRYGLERNPLLNMLECLVVMLMYMFQNKIGVSWIKKIKSVSLLVLKMV
jgi:hypothetical protein